MSKTIIEKKINGETFVKVIEEQKKEKIIKTFEFLEEEKLPKNAKVTINTKISNMLAVMMNENENAIVYYYNELLKVTNIEDLYALFKKMKDEYIDIREKSVSNLYKSFKDIFKVEEEKYLNCLLNHYAKYIVISYFNKLIPKMNSSQIDKIESYFMLKDTSDIPLELLDNSFYKEKKESNLYQFIKDIFSSKISKESNKNKKHRCLDCRAVSVRDCPKLFYEKGKISDYKFITDGYIIRDELGEIHTFFVGTCELANLLDNKEKEKEKIHEKKKR